MTDPATVWLVGRHEVRHRRHDRSQRAFRAGRERRLGHRHQGLLRYRGRAHRPGRAGRAVRPHPSGLGGRRRRPYRQLRGAQGHPDGQGRQGQPPGLSRRLRYRRWQQYRRRHDCRELRRLRQASHGRLAADVFIGSNSSLVAPLKVGKRRQRDGRRRRARRTCRPTRWPSAGPARSQRRGRAGALRAKLQDRAVAAKRLPENGPARNNPPLFRSRQIPCAASSASSARRPSRLSWSTR